MGESFTFIALAVIIAFLLLRGCQEHGDQEARMAALGLEQCHVEGVTVWQRECSK